MIRGRGRFALLSAGIEISHHNMKHLPGPSRIALRCRYFRAAVIRRISIGPRDGWQPCATAANNSGSLGDRNPRLERPIRNLSCGRSRGDQRSQPLVFQRIGHDGLKNSTGSEQRSIVVRIIEGAPAIRVSLLENRPEFMVVNEVEAVRRRRRR